MIDHLPIWVNLLFIIVVVLTIALFFCANGRSKRLLIIIFLCTVIQSLIAYSGFYLNVDAMPPRFLIAMLPAICLIIYGLQDHQKEWILARRNSVLSTILHTIRIPVEIVLLYLFIDGMIPELMTFEGRNFDIIAGITAPIIACLMMRGKISKKVQLVWNMAGLFLILFILINATLSAELPIQMFGLDQPNRAVFYFPFVLLPSIVVPIVIYSHITEIIKLKRELHLLNTKPIQHDA